MRVSTLLPRASDRSGFPRPYRSLFKSQRILTGYKSYTCVTCLWVGSDSCWPYEWVTFTMSCPQEPCSAPPVDTRLCLLLWSRLILIWSSFSVDFFCFPQHYCLFQEIMPAHAVPGIGQLLVKGLGHSTLLPGRVTASSCLFTGKMETQRGNVMSPSSTVRCGESTPPASPI